MNFEGINNMFDGIHVKKTQNKRHLNPSSSIHDAFHSSVMLTFCVGAPDTINTNTSFYASILLSNDGQSKALHGYMFTEWSKSNLSPTSMNFSRLRPITSMDAWMRKVYISFFIQFALRTDSFSLLDMVF